MALKNLLEGAIQDEAQNCCPALPSKQIIGAADLENRFRLENKEMVRIGVQTRKHVGLGRYSRKQHLLS